MAAGKESIKSRELIFKKQNPFEWSEYKEHHHKRMREYIMADPYGCDRCCDTYRKKDLIKLQDERVCRNCL